jgi:hypothetical protein
MFWVFSSPVEAALSRECIARERAPTAIEYLWIVFRAHDKTKSSLRGAQATRQSNEIEIALLRLAVTFYL